MSGRPRTRLQLRLREQSIEGDHNAAGDDGEHREQQAVSETPEEVFPEQEQQQQQQQQEQADNSMTSNEHREVSPLLQPQRENNVSSEEQMEAMNEDETATYVSAYPESSIPRLSHLQRDRPSAHNRVPSRRQARSDRERLQTFPASGSLEPDAKRARTETEEGTSVPSERPRPKKEGKTTYFETTKLETAFQYHTSFDVIVQRAGFVRFSESRNSLYYIDDGTPVLISLPTMSSVSDANGKDDLDAKQAESMLARIDDFSDAEIYRFSLKFDAVNVEKSGGIDCAAKGKVLLPIDPSKPNAVLCENFLDTILRSDVYKKMFYVRLEPLSALRCTRVTFFWRLYTSRAPLNTAVASWIARHIDPQMMHPTPPADGTAKERKQSSLLFTVARRALNKSSREYQSRAEDIFMNALSSEKRNMAAWYEEERDPAHTEEVFVFRVRRRHLLAHYASVAPPGFHGSAKSNERNSAEDAKDQDEDDSAGSIFDEDDWVLRALDDSVRSASERENSAENTKGRKKRTQKQQQKDSSDEDNLTFSLDTFCHDSHVQYKMTTLCADIVRYLNERVPLEWVSPPQFSDVRERLFERQFWPKVILKNEDKQANEKQTGSAHELPLSVQQYRIIEWLQRREQKIVGVRTVPFVRAFRIGTTEWWYDGGDIVSEEELEARVRVHQNTRFAGQHLRNEEKEDEEDEEVEEEEEQDERTEGRHGQRMSGMDRKRKRSAIDDEFDFYASAENESHAKGFLHDSPSESILVDVDQQRRKQTMVSFDLNVAIICGGCSAGKRVAVLALCLLTDCGHYRLQKTMANVAATGESKLANAKYMLAENSAVKSGGKFTWLDPLRRACVEQTNTTPSATDLRNIYSSEQCDTALCHVFSMVYDDFRRAQTRNWPQDSRRSGEDVVELLNLSPLTSRRWSALLARTTLLLAPHGEIDHWLQAADTIGDAHESVCSGKIRVIRSLQDYIAFTYIDLLMCDVLIVAYEVIASIELSLCGYLDPFVDQLLPVDDEMCVPFSVHRWMECVKHHMNTRQLLPLDAFIDTRSRSSIGDSKTTAEVPLEAIHWHRLILANYDHFRAYSKRWAPLRRKKQCTALNRFINVISYERLLIVSSKTLNALDVRTDFLPIMQRHCQQHRSYDSGSLYGAFLRDNARQCITPNDFYLPDKQSQVSSALSPLTLGRGTVATRQAQRRLQRSCVTNRVIYVKPNDLVSALVNSVFETMCQVQDFHSLRSSAADGRKLREMQCTMADYVHSGGVSRTTYAVPELRNELERSSHLRAEPRNNASVSAMSTTHPSAFSGPSTLPFSPFALPASQGASVARITRAGSTNAHCAAFAFEDLDSVSAQRFCIFYPFFSDRAPSECSLDNSSSSSQTTAVPIGGELAQTVASDISDSAATLQETDNNDDDVSVVNPILQHKEKKRTGKTRVKPWWFNRCHLVAHLKPSYRYILWSVLHNPALLECVHAAMVEQLEYGSSRVLSSIVRDGTDVPSFCMSEPGSQHIREAVSQLIASESSESAAAAREYLSDNNEDEDQDEDDSDDDGESSMYDFADDDENSSDWSAEDYDDDDDESDVYATEDEDDDENLRRMLQDNVVGDLFVDVDLGEFEFEQRQVMARRTRTRRRKQETSRENDWVTRVMPNLIPNVVLTSDIMEEVPQCYSDTCNYLNMFKYDLSQEHNRVDNMSALVATTLDLDPHSSVALSRGRPATRLVFQRIEMLAPRSNDPLVPSLPYTHAQTSIQDRALLTFVDRVHNDLVFSANNENSSSNDAEPVTNNTTATTLVKEQRRARCGLDDYENGFRDSYSVLLTRSERSNAPRRLFSSSGSLVPQSLSSAAAHEQTEDRISEWMSSVPRSVFGPSPLQRTTTAQQEEEAEQQGRATNALQHRQPTELEEGDIEQQSSVDDMALDQCESKVSTAIATLREACKSIGERGVALRRRYRLTMDALMKERYHASALLMSLVRTLVEFVHHYSPARLTLSESEQKEFLGDEKFSFDTISELEFKNLLKTSDRSYNFYLDRVQPAIFNAGPSGNDEDDNNQNERLASATVYLRNMIGKFHYETSWIDRDLCFIQQQEERVVSSVTALERILNHFENASESTSDEQCCICLDGLTESDSVALYPCGHMCCWECHVDTNTKAQYAQDDNDETIEIADPGIRCFKCRYLLQDTESVHRVRLPNCKVPPPLPPPLSTRKANENGSKVAFAAEQRRRPQQRQQEQRPVQPVSQELRHALSYNQFVNSASRQIQWQRQYEDSAQSVAVHDFSNYLSAQNRSQTQRDDRVDASEVAPVHPTTVSCLRTVPQNVTEAEDSSICLPTSYWNRKPLHSKTMTGDEAENDDDDEDDEGSLRKVISRVLYLKTVPVFDAIRCSITNILLEASHETESAPTLVVVSSTKALLHELEGLLRIAYPRGCSKDDARASIHVIYDPSFDNLCDHRTLEPRTRNSNKSKDADSSITINVLLYHLDAFHHIQPHEVVTLLPLNTVRELMLVESVCPRIADDRRTMTYASAIEQRLVSRVAHEFSQHRVTMTRFIVPGTVDEYLHEETRW